MKLDSEKKKILVREFGKKNDKKAVLGIIINWIIFLLLISSVYIIQNIFQEKYIKILLYIPISFLIGCSLRGFDNLTHEASHYNIFSKVKLHKKLQFLYSYPVFKILENYKTSHLKHHRNYRNNKKEDPDTLQSIRWGIEDASNNNSIQKILNFYVFRFFTLYYLYDNIRYNFIPTLFNNKSIMGILPFWFSILLLVQITSSWYLFTISYAIPYFIWLPYIRFITESSKHTNVNIQDDFSNSRNNIGFFHQFFLHPHNDGFHQMHHLISSIPFYNLKKAYLSVKKNNSAMFIESSNPI